MLWNYLKIAWRNLRKQPGYGIINITGLAVGLTCCLLIGLFVRHELSYDRWNPLADRIFRPVTDLRTPDAELHFAGQNANIGPDLVAQLPEVVAACRIRQRGGSLVRPDRAQRANREEYYLLSVDSNFFQLFPTPLLHGTPRTALQRPDAVALSASKATAYFGSTEAAMGQPLRFDNEQVRYVTAVFADFPATTHFRADILLSLVGDSEIAEAPPYWVSNFNFHTYLLLAPGTDPAAFEKKFLDRTEAAAAVAIRELLGITPEEYARQNQRIRFGLQPLTTIHLHSDRNHELGANSSFTYVLLFSAIGLFMLLLACINFMNLATARSAGRAREVGVRKVLGGRREHLMRQFLSESTLLTSFAVVLALGLTLLFLPAFENLAGRELALPFGNWWFWVAMVLLTLTVGVVAGSYPAFFLSAFTPTKVLQGQTPGERGGRFRSALVIFQFTSCIVLVTATLFILRQLNYIQQKQLGYDRDRVIILENVYALGPQVAVLKEQVANHPAVGSATLSSYLPVPSNRSDITISKSPTLNVDQSINIQNWGVDEDYLSTLGMKLVAGRNFAPERFATDSSALIINEAAAAMLGLDDPVGEMLYHPQVRAEGAGEPAPSFKSLRIVGVVEDFHWSSLRNEIAPVALRLSDYGNSLTVRLNKGNYAAVIADLEATWTRLAPDQPFSYRFLDAAFDEMYTAERRISRVAGVFAVLFLFISCLGLLGLASYTVERRRREIGIRKVLGSSIRGIVHQLSGPFFRMIAISIALAVPLSWYLVQSWFTSFAYRTTLPWWIFVAAGVGTIAVAYLTVGFQAVRAALADPVDSLRNE